MAHDVLINSPEPVFAEALSRLAELSLDVRARTTRDVHEAEAALVDAPAPLVHVSRGGPDDYALLMRLWRIRPEAPVVVCAPQSSLEAHRAFGPFALLPKPSSTRALVDVIRRALYATPWLQDAAPPRGGLPEVLSTRLGVIDVLSLLRQDTLTFNLWREVVNPSFCVPAFEADPSALPRASYDLVRAFLPRADLSRTNLTRMRLGGACLREIFGAFTQLAGADLRDADFGGAYLVGADLSGADLRGAQFDGAELIGCDLSDARADAGAFNGALVVDCELDPGVEARPPRSA